MKATMTICLVVFLVFGFSQAQEIPGGIVFSDGKNAVYYDYKTEQTTNLTADLKGPAIKGPLAASEDGLMLVWFQNGKFLIRRLPDGNPYLATIQKFTGERENTKVEVIPLPPVQREIRNLMFSPEGTCFAFEFTEKGKYWVQTDIANNPNYPRRNLAGNYGMYPKYEKRTGQEYNAIMVIQPGKGIRGGYGINGECGNSGFYPPTFPFRGTYEDISPGAAARAKRDGDVEGPLMTDVGKPDIKTGISLLQKEAIPRFSIKRDARLLAWQKASCWQAQQHFFALIYQTEKGWSPIEIRDAEPYSYLPGQKAGEIPASDPGSKPGVYEIPVSLNDCKGLAWKPDGSLTYLSGGKVFSIDGDRIREAIGKSGVEHITSYYGKPADFHVVLRNIFSINPVLVAEGIDGDRLHWVTNDTFLFRGKGDGSLRNIYSWHKGKIQKLCPAPDEFSYCDQPPIGVSTAGITSGKDTSVKVAGRGSVIFFVGGMKAGWYDISADAVGIRTKLDGQKTLEFVFPTETNLDDIKNPTRYDYRVRNGDVDSSLRVSLNQIVLLKLDDRYAAIKPVAVEPRKDWKGTPPPPFDQMTYEWKYWSQSAKIAAKEKNANELGDKSLTPTLGKETVLGKLLNRPDRPLPYFYITVGDIKINCSQAVWGRNLNTNTNVVGIEFSAGPLPDGSKPEIASLGGILLESIIDPSKYHYTSLRGSLTIQTGWVIIFKVGDKYVAIKPIELKKQGTDEVLVYEWKYWPIFPADSAKTNSLMQK